METFSHHKKSKVFLTILDKSHNYFIKAYNNKQLVQWIKWLQEYVMWKPSVETKEAVRDPTKPGCLVDKFGL